MSVITISREFGSVGDDFGESVAQALGYHCVCKEQIVALLDQYGMVEFDREYESRPGFWEGFNADRGHRRGLMVAMLNQVVQAEARHGNVVIVGRSGFAILANYADVLHVRLQAPLADRIESIASQEKLTGEQAAARVKERDQIRKAFVEDFYGVPWDAIHGFDLVINTSKTSPDLATTWVVEEAKALALTPADSTLSTRSIEVDAILAKAVSRSLNCTAAHV